MKRAAGLVALLGLLASAGVHIATFLGGRFAPTMHSPIVLLHVALFPLALVLVLGQRREMKGSDKEGPVREFSDKARSESFPTG